MIRSDRTPEASRAFHVTDRMVFQIAVPMIFAYMSVPLIGIVDTAVIGQLGDAALIGGIAVGAVVLGIFITSFNFLRFSTTGLTAQAFGADDKAEQQAVLARALLVTLGLGLAVIALQRPLIGVGLWAMGASTPVDSAAREYLTIRIWGLPLTLANFVLIGWLLGLARAGTVMSLQVLLAVANVCLSLLFVLGFEWGIAGVAWASVAAEAILLAATVPIVAARLQGTERPLPGRTLDRRAFLRLGGVNRDILVRSFCLMFAFAFFTRQGAQFGETILAANAILMHFFMISGHVLDGFATAAEQLAGRAVGARHRPAFDRSVWLSLRWGTVFAGMLMLVYLSAGAFLIDLLTTAPDVRTTARTYLVWAALTPLVGVLAFQMDGTFIGATWSRDMRNMMLLSTIAYLAVWAVATPLLGNHGLWLALLVFLGARGISLYKRLEPRARQTFAAA